jgi:hypothetical protein
VKRVGGFIVSEFWKLLISLLKRAVRHPLFLKGVLCFWDFSSCLVFNALAPSPFPFILVSICPTFKLCQNRKIWYPFIHWLFPPSPESPSSIPLVRLVASPYQTYVFLGLFTVLPILIAYSAIAIRLRFCTIPWAFLSRTKHYQRKSLYLSLRPHDTRCFSSVIRFMAAWSELGIKLFFCAAQWPIATDILFATRRKLEVIHEAVLPLVGVFATFSTSITWICT